MALLFAACAILLSAPEIQAKTKSQTGRVIVQRTPNFGTNLVVHLSIDGRTVANIPRNQHYEGSLSAGQHVLTVVGLPNTDRRQPTSTRIHVRSGRSSIFTAAWEPDRGVVLRPSASANDTTRVTR